MAKYVRFRGGVILRHPETGAPFVPGDDPVEESDPLVQAYRWAFASDDEIAEERSNPPIETATKRPGEKRTTKRS